MMVLILVQWENFTHYIFKNQLSRLWRCCPLFLSLLVEEYAVQLPSY